MIKYTKQFGNKAFQTATQNNIYLQYAGRCPETGMSYYRLSGFVPRETWRMIAEHFERFGFDDADGELRGWLTSQPEAVEKILGVREELTLEYRRRKAEKRREEKKKKTQELQAKVDDIKKAFSDAEYLKTENKMKIEGEKIQNPLNPENPWGGGEWWVIQPDWIWHVRNNGFDGDNWSANNIETGGAGAIGVRVPFSETLAAQIRSLKK
jgi:hypothetical protein